MFQVENDEVVFLRGDVVSQVSLGSAVYHREKNTKNFDGETLISKESRLT